MQVEIWSDVVCPWCYLGKRRFERALESFEHRDEVEVVYRSFELDPTAPPASTSPTVEHLADKYGLSAGAGPRRAAPDGGVRRGRRADVPDVGPALGQHPRRPTADPLAPSRVARPNSSSGCTVRTSPSSARSSTTTSLAAWRSKPAWTPPRWVRSSADRLPGRRRARRGGRPFPRRHRRPVLRPGPSVRRVRSAADRRPARRACARPRTPPSLRERPIRSGSLGCAAAGRAPAAGD